MGGYNITKENILPDPPEFDDHTWLKARSINYYEPIFFEWFKFVGNLTWFTFSISDKSAGFRTMEPVELKILQGRLNRCARLMLGHVALSHVQKFGETTAILDRCIFESSVKVRWLCNGEQGNDRFRRFKADGLKKDLILKTEVEKNIAERGSSLPIEDRMLASIANYVLMSGMTELEISKTSKQPDLRSMMRDLEMNDLQYVIMQGLGSHHVHGTWSSLLLHYLKPNFEALTLELRDHECMADQNTYAATAMMVLTANRDYLNFVLVDGSEEFRDNLIGLMEDTFSTIAELLTEAGETKDRLNRGDWSYISFD